MFSAFSLCTNTSDPCFSGVQANHPHLLFFSPRALRAKSLKILSVPQERDWRYYFMRCPCSATGFRGKLFLRYPPSKACLWIAIGFFFLYGKKWGCSSNSLRYHRKHSATEVLLHLSHDEGGVGISVGPKDFIECLRGAAQRGAQSHFMFAVLRALFLTLSKMSQPFLP